MNSNILSDCKLFLISSICQHILLNPFTNPEHSAIKICVMTKGVVGTLATVVWSLTASRNYIMCSNPIRCRR